MLPTHIHPHGYEINKQSCYSIDTAPTIITRAALSQLATGNVNVEGYYTGGTPSYGHYSRHHISPAAPDPVVSESIPPLYFQFPNYKDNHAYTDSNDDAPEPALPLRFKYPKYKDGHGCTDANDESMDVDG